VKTLERYQFTALAVGISLLSGAFRLFPDLPPSLQWLLTLLVGLLEHRKNGRDALAAEDRRTNLYNYACSEPFERLRTHDPTARLSIFEVDVRPFGPDAFRPVFQLGMDGAPDLDLGLTTEQGVAGEAYRRADLTVADLALENGPDFGLTQEQLEKTRDLTLAISVPVKRARKLPDGTYALTDRIVGTVNLDSRLPDALAFYSEGPAEGGDGTLLDLAERELRKISELCSYIID